MRTPHNSVSGVLLIRAALAHVVLGVHEALIIIAVLAGFAAPALLAVLAVGCRGSTAAEPDAAPREVCWPEMLRERAEGSLDFLVVCPNGKFVSVTPDVEEDFTFFANTICD